MRQSTWMFYLATTTNIFNFAIFICCNNLFPQTLIDIAFILNIFLLYSIYEYKKENDYVSSLFEKAGITKEHLKNE